MATFGSSAKRTLRVYTDVSITFDLKVVAEVSVPRAMSMSSPAAAIGAANTRIRPRSPEQNVGAAPPLRHDKPTIEYLDAQMLELKNGKQLIHFNLMQQRLFHLL